jgi:hypothetical protein
MFRGSAALALIVASAAIIPEASHAFGFAPPVSLKVRCFAHFYTLYSGNPDSCAQVSQCQASCSPLRNGNAVRAARTSVSYPHAGTRSTSRTNSLWAVEQLNAVRQPQMFFFPDGKNPPDKAGVPTFFPPVDRIVAVGDVHGDVDALKG